MLLLPAMHPCVMPTHSAVLLHALLSLMPAMGGECKDSREEWMKQESNVQRIVCRAAKASWPLRSMTSRALSIRMAVALVILHACMAPAVAQGSSASIARSGSDRIREASLPDIGTVTPSYDATYGHVTALDGGTYSLSTTHDAYSGKPLTQTLVQTGDTGVKTTLSNVGNSYDALGRRINRTVDGGQLSPATVSTDYWYGPIPLKPLAVERQGGTGNKKGRMIYLGDEVLAIESGPERMQASYPVADHLGSIRAVLDGEGNTTFSLGYDDWGKTTISGQDSAVDVGDLSLLFRFQGIEQDIFPLTTLGIGNPGALAWLDGIGLYHYFGRDYVAGLAAFLAMDPAGASVSPYSAFAASPANFIDPDGMVPLTWRAAIGRMMGYTEELESFIAHMRKNGMEKIIISELHQQEYLLDIVGRILAGARNEGPLKFWSEVNLGTDKKYEKTVLSRLKRVHAKQASDNEKKDLLFRLVRAVDKQLGEGNYSLSHEKEYLVDRMMDALLSDEVVAEFMILGDPARSDITDFIHYKGFAVARMGSAHAMYRVNAQRQAVIPYLKNEQAIEPVFFDAYQRLEQEKFNEIWNAFDRAVSQSSNVMMMIPGTTYHYPQPKFSRARILPYYRKKGFAVLEMPISAGSSPTAPGYNVTIITSSAFTPAIVGYINNMYYPDKVNFNCTGLPGCPPVKDEL